MKLISWNVNGLNSAMRHGLAGFIKKENADVYCFQETKMSEKKVPKEIEGLKSLGYEEYHVFSNKNGYAGVTILTKIKPISVIKGLDHSEFDKEGRVLILEFDKFYFIGAYFPNSQRGLARLDYKLKFNKAFLEFCKKLEKKKPLVITGDLNVAHKEIDIKNAKANEKNAGFTIEERNWFTEFIDNGFIDTFREFNKEPGNYTWWSYMFNARKKGIGWRIDYWVISKSLRKNLKKSEILKDVLGSDHCPVLLEMS